MFQKFARYSRRGGHDPKERQDHGEDEYSAMASLPSSKYVLGTFVMSSVDINLFDWEVFRYNQDFDN